MIAAARRRRMVARVRLEAWTRAVDRAGNRLLTGRARVGGWTRTVDRRANAALVRAWPWTSRVLRRVRRLGAVAWRRVRPLVVVLFRALYRVERVLVRIAAAERRAAGRASAVLTPARAVCLLIVAAAACLAVAQFVEYRAVEVGQPGYAGIALAEAPRVAGESPTAAHSYLLLVAALAAGGLGLVALLRPARRRGLGRIVFALGALALAVALLIDLPAGLDAGVERARFAGASAVLEDGFYAQIAAAAGLMLGGALLSSAHRIPGRHGYRRRKPRLARTQGGRRRARTSSA